MRVFVSYADLPYDSKALRLSNGAAQDALLDARRKQLAPSLVALRAKLASAGATSVKEYWLASTVFVELPAKALDRVAAIPGVTMHDNAHGQVTADGLDARNKTNAPVYLSRYIRGGVGGRLPGPVIIGQIEPDNLFGPRLLPGNVPRLDHPGFREVQGSSSRIIDVRDCRQHPPSGLAGWGCLSATAAPFTLFNHSIQVARRAIGSIDMGQDPAFPGSYTSEQARRGGIATEAQLRFYAVAATGGTYGEEEALGQDVWEAYQQAMLDGVDIINQSFRFGDVRLGDFCSSTYNPAGLNAAITALADSGILVVSAAANDKHDPAKPCTLSWPGWHPDAISVGANDVDGTLWFKSSAGPVTMRTSNGISVPYAGIGLTTLGTYDEGYGAVPSSNYIGAAAFAPSNPFYGTSFAAPTVAGSAALLRHLFNYVQPNGGNWPSRTWPGGDARFLLTSLLVFADGWEASTGNGATSGFDPWSGAGRLRLRFAHPTSTDVTSPFYFDYSNGSIGQGQLECHHIGPYGQAWSPMPATAKRLKTVLTWKETDFQNIADVDLTVYNTCPGGTPQQNPLHWVPIGTDWGYSPRARVLLSNAQIQGKCLAVCAYGYTVPSPRPYQLVSYLRGGYEYED